MPIVETPGTLGGRPRIAGRRIAVAHVATWHYQWKWDVAQIMAEFDLTQQEVAEALAYYAEHREIIDAHTRADEAWLEEQRHAE